jgi:hypothetical protein
MQLLYIGKATDLYAETRQTLKRQVQEVRPWKGSKRPTFREVTQYVSAFTIARGDAEFRHDVEALFLKCVVNNTWNRNRGQFKRRS